MIIFLQVIVTVIVLDKNDNFPLFQNTHSQVNVSENSKIGKVFYRIVALDSDDGKYGEVNYKFKNKEDLFNLDAQVINLILS